LWFVQNPDGPATMEKSLNGRKRKFEIACWTGIPILEPSARALQFGACASMISRRGSQYDLRSVRWIQHGGRPTLPALRQKSRGAERSIQLERAKREGWPRRRRRGAIGDGPDRAGHPETVRHTPDNAYLQKSAGFLTATARTSNRAATGGLRVRDLRRPRSRSPLKVQMPCVAAPPTTNCLMSDSLRSGRLAHANKHKPLDNGCKGFSA
jgi:hypothetical protein